MVYLSDGEVATTVHKFGEENDGGQAKEERRGVVHRLVERVVARHKARHLWVLKEQGKERRKHERYNERVRIQGAITFGKKKRE